MKVFAGLGLVGLLVIGRAPDGEAAVKKVEIKVDSKCNKASMDGPDKVRKGDGDILLISFSNACAKKQALYVCARTAAGSTAVPTGCKGFPATNRPKIGERFEMKAGTEQGPSTAHAVCDVSYPAADFPKQTFCLYVDSGATTSKVTCPPQGARCKGPDRGTEIAIEVEP